MSGAVAKGPFVLGSAIDVSTLDAALNPTGSVYSTVTTNDAGAFSLAFQHTGPVELIGQGFYYNEITGALSTAPITLRAYYEVEQSGAQSAFINIVTHLTHDRIATLVRGGAALANAVAQAETELRMATGIGGPGFDPGVPGIAMDLTGGDTKGNAYLFAVSSIIAQAASARGPGGASLDAHLQELVNAISVDLAPDGALEAAMLEELRTAESLLSVGQVESRFGSRLASIGSSATVPDLDQVVDTDVDDVVNALDNCPLDPNPNQEDADSDGVGDACFCGNGILNLGEQCDDGNVVSGDGCQAACVFAQCGDGVYDRDVPDPDDLYCYQPSCTEICLHSYLSDASVSVGATVVFVGSGDFDGDGIVDLLALSSAGDVRLLEGQDDGSFMAASTVVTLTDPVWGLVADVNGDGRDDAFVFQSTGDTRQLFGDAAVGLSGGGAMTGQAGSVRGELAEMTGDGKLDLVTIGSPAGQGTVRIAAGDGAGGFAAPSEVAVTGAALMGLAIADVVGTSSLDVLVGDSTLDAGDLYILAGDGAGSLALTSTIARDTTTAILTGDVIGDAATDIVAAGGGYWFLLENLGSDTFEAPIYVDFSDGNEAPGVDSGPPTLVLLEPVNGVPATVYTNLDGLMFMPLSGFGTPAGQGTGYNGAPGPFVYRDLNGDGAPDYVYIRPDAPSSLGVRLNEF